MIQIGITLIALVVTIIALLILAGVAINLTIGDNGIITRASKARLTSELATYKEELEMYSVGKELENNGFMRDTLTAGKEKLNYNTKPEGEEGNIKTIINSISDEYLEKLEVIKGELLINTKDKNEIEIAQSLGIEVNPYDITEEGELLSSYGNLLLMSEDGTLTIPERVTKIGEGAFANLEGLKTIIIPGTCKEIAKDAFRNSVDLQNVIIEDGVQVIGESAFKDCTNLSMIKLPDSLETIEASCFWGCSNLSEITIPSKIKVIKSHTFASCYNLTKVELSENLESIELRGFYRCNITKIKLPAYLKSIGNDAFGQNKNLTTIEVEEENSVFDFDESRGMLIQNNWENEKRTIVFMTDTALKSSNTLDIPEGVTSLGLILSDYAIEQVNIPSSLIGISAESLPGSVANIIVDKNNKNYIVKGNCLYSIDKKKLIICFSKDKQMLKSDFADELEVIKAKAFTQAPNLTNIELPDSVLTIEEYAFWNNNKLESLKLGSKINNISPVFKFTNHSGEVTIDKNNANYTIENNILYDKNKTKLISVLYKIDGEFILDNSIEQIGRYAFYYQGGLTDIKLTNNLKSIDGNAFEDTSLKSIYIPSSVSSIDSKAFTGINSLELIQIDKEDGSIVGSPWGAIKGNKIVEWLK